MDFAERCDMRPVQRMVTDNSAGLSVGEDLTQVAPSLPGLRPSGWRCGTAPHGLAAEVGALVEKLVSRRLQVPVDHRSA